MSFATRLSCPNKAQSIWILPNMNTTVEKLEICSHCNKGFRSKSQLKIHERIHTGQKSQKCSYCPKTFNVSVQKATPEKVIWTNILWSTLVNPLQKLVVSVPKFLQMEKLLNSMREFITVKRHLIAIFAQQDLFLIEVCKLIKSSCTPKIGSSVVPSVKRNTS